MLYKYRKRNNNFATTGLVGEFRASSPPKKKLTNDAIWCVLKYYYNFAS